MNIKIPPHSQLHNMERILFFCNNSKFVTSSRMIATFNASDSAAEAELGDLPPRPVTVLNVVDREIPDSTWLKAKKSQMLADDDVFNEEFFKCIILSNALQLPTGISRSEVRLEDGSKSTIHEVRTGGSVRNGPYFAIGSALFQVFKLYDDPQDAFMFGVQVDEDQPESFIQYFESVIPVPSRLYFDPPNLKHPLSGKRFAVKDVYDMKGVPTSASCRDYQSFIGKADVTAEMILRLTRAGAVIVGKTKTAQFACGENAPDWVDYSCPFNPRGDGYMDPDGSSTGSGAELAAYEWLDHSIGTDTLGSMVGPSASNGVFGIRPTHGISNLQGVFPVSRLLDTAGCFSRSISDLKTVGLSWYEGQIENPRFQSPLRVLYAPEEFNKFSEPKRLIMDAFIEDLETVLKISKTDFSIASTWDEEAPPSCTRPIQKFLATTLAHIQLYDCYHNNAKWRNSFKETRGREPYVNPIVRFKWGLGANLTPQDYEKACSERETYRTFLREEVFNESTVLVLPCGSPIPRYRDVYDRPPAESGYNLQGFGFLRDLYGFLGGLPLLIIPVGQALVESSVTKEMVSQPVCISMVGAPGTDGQLINLAEHIIKESGRPLQVKVGRTLFEV